jgi:hypothetical protein
MTPVLEQARDRPFSVWMLRSDVARVVMRLCFPDLQGIAVYHRGPCGVTNSPTFRPTSPNHLSETPTRFLMTGSPLTLDELSHRLSVLTTIEDKLDAIKSISPIVDGIGILHDDGTTTGLDAGFQDDSDLRLKQLLDKHGLTWNQVGEHISKRVRSEAVCSPFATSLKLYPCANADPSRVFACPNEGIRACSGCKVLAYCSAVSCSGWHHLSSSVDIGMSTRALEET